METIYFYAPDEDSYRLLQHNYHEWAGTHSNFVAWIAPTYFHLKNAGFPCEVTRKMPDKGIVLADRDTLGDQQNYLANVMLICAKSDREYYPAAHLHVIHNLPDFHNTNNALWHPYYIPHWPLPNLTSRSSQRGNLLKNVAYIGSRSQLAAELKSEQWHQALQSIGCEWLPIFEPRQWNDYRQIDLVVAARTFRQNNYVHKGAIKLFNCWRAGVPAILTPESAFLSEKKSDLDFFLVTSLEEAIEAVRTLKNNPDLYQAIIANGFERARELTTEGILERWITFFHEFAFPMYEQWCDRSETHKKTLFVLRYLRLKQDRLFERIETKVSPFRDLASSIHF